MYGAGKFGYTVNEASATIASGSATVAQASSASVNWNANYTATSGLKAVSFTIPTGADYNAINAFFVSGAALPSGYYPEFTTLSGTTLTFIAPGATADGTGHANSTITLKYEAQPTSYNRGDFEDRDPINNGTTVESAGTNLDIPQVDLELKSEAIVAKTRKLKAVWTPELAQDLNAYHSIDAEAELTSMLSEYISLEIDLEILDMLKANALTTEYWSLKVGQEWNGSAFAIDSDVATASAYTRNTWFQTLGTKLNKVSNKIHQLTMRGGANFMVASPDVCTILESIPAFSVSADKDAKQFAAGVTQVGSIANRYTVYKNPYMTENVILMGYKGNNFLETGAVYAPYVPLILTPLVYDPDNFTPRRGVMTRYAKKLVRPEFFGKVVIGDLNLL